MVPLASFSMDLYAPFSTPVIFLRLMVVGAFGSARSAGRMRVNALAGYHARYGHMRTIEHAAQSIPRQHRTKATQHTAPQVDTL